MDAAGTAKGTRRRVLGLLLVLGNVALVAEIGRHALRRWRGAGSSRGGTTESRRDLLATLAAADTAGPGHATPDVVLLGDSLVALAEWGELFPGRSIRNRGISGDTTADILARVDEAVAGSPRLVVVAAGINDLFRGEAPEAVAERHARIAARVRAVCPQARLLIHAVLPVRRAMLDIDGTAELVPILNEKLRLVAAQVGADYLDPRSALVDAHGELDARLTTDGVHLNGAGYLRWRDALETAIR